MYIISANKPNIIIIIYIYHISYIREKLCRSIAITYKIKNKLPLKNRIHIYHSICESHLNYGSSNWGSTFLSNIQPIIILQNRVIANLFFLLI